MLLYVPLKRSTSFTTDAKEESEPLLTLEESPLAVFDKDHEGAALEMSNLWEKRETDHLPSSDSCDPVLAAKRTSAKYMIQNGMQSGSTPWVTHDAFAADDRDSTDQVTEEEDDEDSSAELQVLLATLLVLLVVLVVVLWTVLVSTYHRSAVDDLMQQLANSTDTALSSSLGESQKMVQKATNIWQFTGALVTDLGNTSAWATDLLAGHYRSARLGSLRFATTTGLEQTSNATYFNGSYDSLRVLSREFYGHADSPLGKCLKEYQKVNLAFHCHQIDSSLPRRESSGKISAGEKQLLRSQILSQAQWKVVLNV